MHGHIDARARVFPECVLLRASGPPHDVMTTEQDGPEALESVPLGKKPSGCVRWGHPSECRGKSLT
jgi:hypothetical protein